MDTLFELAGSVFESDDCGDVLLVGSLAELAGVALSEDSTAADDVSEESFMGM
ncbi:hypothetical protein [Fibrobacter sp.]|uniref:hypothetical protein n=1 Tax=Fibrobacter sp. TaxID=35828 RepID=UPI003890BBB1